MRKILRRLEVMPARVMTLLGVGLYGALGALAVLASIEGTAGALELLRILGLALYLGALLLFIRRRQHDAWSSGIQMTVLVFGGVWFSVLLVYLIKPAAIENVSGFGFAFGATVILGPVIASIFALMIWLSRKLAPRPAADSHIETRVRSNEEL